MHHLLMIARKFFSRVTSAIMDRGCNKGWYQMRVPPALVDSLCGANLIVRKQLLDGIYSIDVILYMLLSIRHIDSWSRIPVKL